jgi:hypothetical protein
MFETNVLLVSTLILQTKELFMGKNWDASDEAAKKLNLEDFGTPEQISDIAFMERQPKTYDETRKIMFGFINVYISSRSGLIATISKKSIKKILSGKNISESFDFKAHLMAAGNLDKLYNNAIEPWSFAFNPEKNNENLTSVRRLYSIMNYNKKLVVVKITVKEMKNSRDGNRIYSIKALDLYMDKKIEDVGILARGSSQNPPISPGTSS